MRFPGKIIAVFCGAGRLYNLWIAVILEINPDLASHERKDRFKKSGVNRKHGEYLGNRARFAGHHARCRKTSGSRRPSTRSCTITRHLIRQSQISERMIRHQITWQIRNPNPNLWGSPCKWRDYAGSPFIAKHHAHSPFTLSHAVMQGHSADYGKLSC